MPASLALALIAVGPALGQVTINATFDSSITSDPNVMQIEAGINAAISRMEAAVTNNITVNITFAETNTGLGSSNTSHFTVQYGQYLTALQTQQTPSANDATALASLPPGPNNPVNGSGNVFVQTTLARALKIASFSGSDGTISLNTSIMNLSRTGPQNPSFFDLQAVAAHEIDEVFGIGGPGSAMQLSGAYTGQPPPTGAVGPLDLFRYSAVGTRSFTMDPNAVAAYFSINSGTTDLVHFNQNGFVGTSGADFGDWGTGAPGASNTSGNSPPQVQDAFGTPGAIVNIGTNELTALDVIGYDVSQVPEPSTLLLTSAGLAAAAYYRRRAPRYRAA
jgi:hypothetical protein